MNMQFGFRTASRNYMGVKKGVFESIVRRFDQENIEILFPHVSLYGGEETKSLPVELVAPVPTNNSGRKKETGKIWF